MLLPLSSFGQQFDCVASTFGGKGPWDYNSPADRASMLPVVEGGHFDSNVENLVRGLSSADVMDDIHYTLNRFPNHHRALYSMARYFLTKKQSSSPGAHRSPDCYFDLGMRWRPEDGMVRMIYGIFLHKSGRNEDAVQRYQEAIELMPNSAEAHYNLALLYVDGQRYDLATEHAHDAYRLGYPLPGLRNKLKRLGVWMPEVSSARAEE